MTWQISSRVECVTSSTRA